MMDTSSSYPLPTPPRSPMSSANSSPVKSLMNIKEERMYDDDWDGGGNFFNNPSSALDFDVKEELDALEAADVDVDYGIVKEEQEQEEEEGIFGGFSMPQRKRKLSELLGPNDFDGFFRDFEDSLFHQSNFDFTSTTPPPTRPPSPSFSSHSTSTRSMDVGGESSSNDNSPHSSSQEDDLSDFLSSLTSSTNNFSTNEIQDLLLSTNSTVSCSSPSESSSSPPLRKRQKYDSCSSSSDGTMDNLIQDCFLFDHRGEDHYEDCNLEKLMMSRGFEEEEEEEEEIRGYTAEHIREACRNDHNYCKVGGEDEEVVVKKEKEMKVVLPPPPPPPTVKKTTTTKILVPLKSLMRTLQEKSFLVSPLGPGKKVIRLTNGESVKGVFQSTTHHHIITTTTTTTTTNPPPSQPPIPTPPQIITPQRNVRKRPHSNLLTTSITSSPSPSSSSSSQNLHDEDLDLLSLISCGDDDLSTFQSNSPSSKKKTKAHNNMERMRRIDLRNSFDNLKKLVPILAKSPKCSKVEILKRAEEYVRGLRTMEKKLVKEEQLLRVRMSELKGRLVQGTGE